MDKITIIDYGMGNLGSILNMLKKIGVVAEPTKSSDDILKANKLILPGVGSFDKAMNNLNELNYIDVLSQKVLIEKIPILGICLGMQLFGKHSEEGNKQGLGWLDAMTVRFKFEKTSNQYKIPHMGWNTIRVCKKSYFFSILNEEYCFYFVHSFHLQCNNPNDVLTCTNYGLVFTSAVCHNNIIGVQFHPEKSHRYGLEFFKAFAAWTPEITAKQ